MDLITLNSSNQPESIIENYDSLIWTERFNTVGDFQITTGDVDWFMDRLPEGTVLSLRESNVAMIVETHQIDRKKNSPQVLTIRGRSYESVLDRRVAISAISSGISDWTVNAKIPSDVAYYIIVKIVVDGILDSADIFPSSKIQFITPSDYLNTSGPTKAFTVPKANLLSAVLDLLQTEAKADSTTSPVTPKVVPHGIRAIRPNSSGTAVGIEIYTGIDRSDTVYFDGSRSLLDDGSYLFSKVGSATAAYILGENSTAKMSKKSTTPTGLDRRVILVDGTTSGLTDVNALRAQGEMSLTEARETAIFDGSINQDLSPYIYGQDYHLGDVVRLVGDYGLDMKARVTEYIRSEDATGTKSYPTLVAIEE